ncbi:hypothetical protein D3C75_945680 [compost metagenome]
MSRCQWLKSPLRKRLPSGSRRTALLPVVTTSPSLRHSVNVSLLNPPLPVNVPRSQPIRPVRVTKSVKASCMASCCRLRRQQIR